MGQAPASFAGRTTKLGRLSAAVPLVTAALLCLSITSGSASADPRNVPRPRTASSLVGATSPSLDASHVAGTDAVSLDRLRGRVVILDFWATWCRPCRSVSSMLETMHSQYRDRGLRVLGISNEAQATIESHLRRRPVGYTIARDQGATASRFAVRALPTLVVLDRTGKVREVYEGIDQAGARRLIATVEALLDEPVP